MPRKQRFKPSRKPKPVGAQTELAPIQAAAAPTKTAGLRDVVSGDHEATAAAASTDAPPP